METKDYLKQVIDALVNGNETLAKDAHHAYVETKSQELLKEDKMSLVGARQHIKKLEDAIKKCDSKDSTKLKELKDELEYAKELFDDSEENGDFDE